MYYAYGPSILITILRNLNIGNDETVIVIMQDDLHFVHPIIVNGGLGLKE